MKKALVLGGSGLIGQQLIGLLLQKENYSVTALVRTALPIQHKRLIQVIVNFENPNEEAIMADEIFCCLGTTSKVAGSKQAFYKVDFEYVLQLAKMGFRNGAKKFALVSSMGANKNSAVFYNKTKGAIEEAVACIGYESLFIFRPSLLLGKRKEFRLGEQIAQFIFTWFAILIPKKYRAIQSMQVAKAMVTCMDAADSGLFVVDSDKIANL